MKGYIKAAYIYSLLPQHIKSLLFTRLNTKEQSRLEKGLQEVPLLSVQQHIAILKEFTHLLEEMYIQKKRHLDYSIIASGIILSCIIILAITISGWQALKTFQFIIQFGGFHAVLLPFVILYTSRLFQQSFFEIIKPAHIVYDILIAIITATAIVIIFSLTIPTVPIVASKEVIVALLCAITAVPMTEELFFRGILFLHGGRRYGFLPAWFFASFVFATIHLPNTPLQFTAYFVCSSMLCFVAYRFSLFASIVAHMLSNSILFIL